jgi:hypothetical protein
MGYYYNGASHLPPTISPGKRWLLATDTGDPPYQRMVWDLMRQEIVTEIPTTLKDPIYMIYNTEGFIVHSLDVGEVMSNCWL